MEKQRTKVNSEEQLLQARERSLQEAKEVNAMNAHGKVLGMDTFSWINPQIDILSTVIDSLPFNIIWVGNHEQIKNCLELYPNIIKNIQTIIVQDETILNLDRKLINEIENVVCIEGTSFALEFVKTMKQAKSAFLFTTGGANSKRQKENFDQFISLFQ